MSISDKDRIVQRVQKLVNLADNSGAFEGEASNAMKYARDRAPQGCIAERVRDRQASTRAGEGSHPNQKLGSVLPGAGRWRERFIGRPGTQSGKSEEGVRWLRDKDRS